MTPTHTITTKVNIPYNGVVTNLSINGNDYPQHVPFGPEDKLFIRGKKVVAKPPQPHRKKKND